MSKRINIRSYTYLFFFLINFSFVNSAFAESYFDQVLAGVSSIKIVRDVVDNFSVFKNNPNFWNFGRSSQQVSNNSDDSVVPPIQEQVVVASEDENIFMGNEEGELVLSKAEKEKLEKENKEKERREKQESVLAKVLERLGVVKSSGGSTTQTPNNNQSQPLNNNLTQPVPLNPLTQNPFVQQPGFTNSNLSGGQNGLSPYTGNAVQQYLPTAQPQTLTTPYSGPGGAIPGECGIPKGPWAYNIGGNNVRCDARVIVKQFRGQDISGISKDKVWLAGYVNPAVQKDLRSKFPSPNCGSSAGKYGEGCFVDYSSGAGQAYVQWQLLHWQEMGDKVGQKCVPIDIDNCDAIGTKNYLAILEQIRTINNQSGKAKLLVLNKNPHNNCNFMSHPAVGGAFVEISGDNPTDVVRKVAATRNKAEQVLVFARGGPGTNDKVRAAQNSGIKNSAFSFDQGGEYQNVVDCTYNP